MVMAPPFPTCYHLSQPFTPTTPLFTNFSTRSNNLSIRPGKKKIHVPATLSFTATNPSHEQLKTPPNKQTTKDLDFEDRTTRTRVKRFVQRIVELSSSNTKTAMLQILEKDSELKTITVFNHLLTALLIAQEHELCLSLFTKLQSFQFVPDCCTYSIMIRCHCERNDLDEAKTAFDTVVANGFQPDTATITVLLNSLCKRGRVQKAMEVFEVMGRMGCNLSVQAQNCLLKGLCYVGKVEEAFEMLMSMKETMLNPNVYSYTVVMDGLCKVGRSDEAMELLNEAVGMGIVPNVVTFNTLLQGYSREGRAMEGVSVLRLMKKHGCDPNSISYNTVLHGLLKWKAILAALGIYKEMVALGFEVDVGMMGKLVRCLCKISSRKISLLQDADEVFDKMIERGSSMVDKRTLEVLVQALCREKKVDVALARLKDMVRLGYSPETITFNKVIQGLCDKGRVEEAMSTLLLLRENRGVPNRISYDKLIKELNEQGTLFCASNLFGAALKQGIVPKWEPRLCSQIKI